MAAILHILLYYALIWASVFLLLHKLKLEMRRFFAMCCNSDLLLAAPALLSRCFFIFLKKIPSRYISAAAIGLFIFCQCNNLKTNDRIMKYKFNFNTSHNQFYISDKFSSTNIGLDDFWTNKAYEDKLAIGKDIIAIGTECYGNVKGELVILEKPVSTIEFNLYDHIVEGGLELKSGDLRILDCPNSSIQLEVKVKPGTYRVRIYSSNLASVVDDDGDDYYKIEIWESDNIERKVLKRYVGK